MPQQDVELVRRWLWAFVNDGDAFLQLTHPEIEWAPFEENHTVFHGHAGAMQIRTEWLASWDEVQIELEEVLDGSDGMVSVAHVTGRGRESGVPADVRLYGHIKVRDGKCAYLFEYLDRAEALTAAGLGE
jgi:ketosteroid isomerase-like protein